MGSLKAFTPMAVLAVVAFGCAGMGGPNDETLIMGVITDYVAAMDAGNVDDLMALYSKDFTDARGTTYDELRSRLDRMLPLISQYEVEIDTSEVVVTVDGNSAEAGPVVLTGAGRSMSSNLILAKEGGTWRITGTERNQ